MGDLEHLNKPADAPASSMVEIDVMDGLRDIWRAKYTILFAIFVGIVIASLHIRASRDMYTANAVISPAESNNQNSLSSSISGLSGTASLFGVHLGSSTSTDYVKFQQLLTSERLAKTLFQDKALRPLFFPGLWSAETQSWRPRSGMLANIKKFIGRALGRRGWSPPDQFTLQADLKRRLTILQDKVTNYTTLSIQSDSPAHAKALLTAIISADDDLIRRGVKSRSANRITYLRNELAHITQQDQREAVISVLSAEEKTMMMSSVDKTYAIDIIDPASSAPVPTSPNIAATMIEYAMALFLITCLASVGRGALYVRRAASEVCEYREPSLDVALLNWLRSAFAVMSRRLGRSTSGS